MKLGDRKKLQKLYVLFLPKRVKIQSPNFHPMGNSFQNTGRISKLPQLHETEPFGKSFRSCIHKICRGRYLPIDQIPSIILASRLVLTFPTIQITHIKFIQHTTPFAIRYFHVPTACTVCSIREGRYATILKSNNSFFDINNTFKYELDFSMIYNSKHLCMPDLSANQILNVQLWV